MRLLSIGAISALALGLGGCMGMGHDMNGMHNEMHQEGMMGQMMGQHGQANCPGAQQGQHAAQDAPSGAPAEAGHEHAAADAQCPPAAAEQPHQHEPAPQPQ